MSARTTDQHRTGDMNTDVPRTLHFKKLQREPNSCGPMSKQYLVAPVHTHTHREVPQLESADDILFYKRQMKRFVLFYLVNSHLLYDVQRFSPTNVMMMMRLTSS
ncbi:Hypothetical protein SMAX5B_019558 [Scophthalmus maximus]|uniref:Uncharacterized protein n=1 Tax=Scophthalmus maximus TaxID=52904 RepID=A0A2U9C2L4_SCOMX|nr:Hypothetical protein SMAX5B_019558 [Scophthalmus maximus]